jgi:hypothetical protein
LSHWLKLVVWYETYLTLRNGIVGTFTLMAGTGNTVERQCGTELTPLPAGTVSVCFACFRCMIADSSATAKVLYVNRMVKVYT